LVGYGVIVGIRGLARSASLLASVGNIIDCNRNKPRALFLEL
jgi:hypothetical protein